MKITSEKLNDIIDYSPKTGIFTWKINKRRVSKGDEAGTIAHNGYRNIKINGRVYLAHRLAYLLMNGDYPNKRIDHINGNKSDNRWNNLRVCEQYQNCANSKLSTRNSSGYKGVSLDNRRGTWVVQHTVRGKLFRKSGYKTAEEAHREYCRSAESLNGDFARTA